MMRRFALCFLLLPLLISCATPLAKEPAWLTHTYDETYPQALYLAAVGSGSDRNAAVDRAHTALSQVFSTAVQATIVTSTHVSSEGSSDQEARFRESSDFFAFGEISTLIEHIVGSEVVSTYTDQGGEVHARVVMHREKSAENYRRQITDLVQQRSAIAQSRAHTTDPLEAWMLLNEEIALARQEEALGAQVATLTNAQPRSAVVPLALEQKKIATHIGVEVTVAADKTAAERITTALAAWITEQGFFYNAEGPYRLSVTYADETEEMAGSPYAHVRYQISGSLQSDTQHYLSFEVSKRETALSETQARARAVENAAKAAVADISKILSTYVLRN